MQVLIADLHEHAAARREQLAREKQPVAHVGEIRVQAQLPRVAVGFHHLRLAREVLVVSVRDVALAHERLEVAAELHAVGRVDVDHLHLAAQSLVVQERVHHDERVAEDQAVHPLVGILVGLEHLVGDRVPGIPEHFPEVRLLVCFVADEGLDDGFGGEALVYEERQRRDVEGQALGLARPVEERAAQALELINRLLE